MAAQDVSSRPDRLNAEQAQSVREHLKHLLGSPEFAASKRTQDFLRLIVDHALAGELDSLRERMIGVELFGRRVDYDTANDAVVRVMASKIRHRLAQYYSSTAPTNGVRIELPIGSYVPQFCWTPAEDAASAIHLEVSGKSSSDAAMNEQITTVSKKHAMTARLSLREWILIAFSLVLLATVCYTVIRQRANPFSSQRIRSIAILPVVNLSGDPSQEYFADGMTEELTAELGQVTSLRVISRTSTMLYKRTKKTLPEIARELNVDSIIESSVEREGNRVRITAQLIDSRADRHLWAQSYDRDMSNVLELQSDVARMIADQIQIKLTPQEQTRLTRPRTVRPEVEEFYLRGMERLNAHDPKTARSDFEKAIQFDPNYAPAHAALSDCYERLGSVGLVPPTVAFAAVGAEARKAVEIDDSLPQGHLQLGFAAMLQGFNWAMQDKEFQRAIKLNPNLAVSHQAYADYLMRTGKNPEAIAEAELALQLDPVSGHSYIVVGQVYYFAHQYDQALLELQHAAALHADSETLFPMAMIHAEKGKYEQAIQEFQQANETPFTIGHMGNAYARMGRPAEARATIAKLQKYVKDNDIGRYEIALVYAGLRENDRAFEWLEKAYQVQDRELGFLEADPCLTSLRSDPRFQALLQRVGLHST